MKQFVSENGNSVDSRARQTRSAIPLRTWSRWEPLCAINQLDDTDNTDQV